MKRLEPWALLFAAAKAALVDDCPGYQASNIVNTDHGLTADLKLAGDACDLYGDDLTDLKLLVEYQTGKLSDYSTHYSANTVAIRLTPARYHIRRRGAGLSNPRVFYSAA